MVFNFNGKIIKVSNWWNWEGKGAADLYLDNKHLIETQTCW